ncbi:MAG: cytochrome c biogenesis protein CcdA [bacterium]|nr:cytochrome c biogenesis protein CcdA [bacterium]
MEAVLFQTSLIAAFVAGMVALFAPCCITFLLPAYLGSVFKEKEKILFMTLVFGAGIFVVLLPAVIGVSLISQLLFRYHNLVYYLGGGAMILVSIVTFLGLKLPMPHFKAQDKAPKADIASIFTLGIFSGITSACCAPVLIGILTLTFLTPSFFGGLAIGSMYVLGMVTPLLLISLFLDNRIPKMAFIRRPMTSFKLAGRTYLINLGNTVAAAIFFATGFFTIILTYTGVLTADGMEKYTKVIENGAIWANTYIGTNSYLNFAFLIIALFFIFSIFKQARKK